MVIQAFMMIWQYLSKMLKKKSRDNGNTDYHLTIFTGFCNNVRLYVDGKHVPTSQRQILNFYKLTIEKFRY